MTYSTINDEQRDPENGAPAPKTDTAPAKNVLVACAMVAMAALSGFAVGGAIQTFHPVASSFAAAPIAPAHTHYELTSVHPVDCPTYAEYIAFPKCADAKVGELCEPNKNEKKEPQLNCVEPKKGNKPGKKLIPVYRKVVKTACTDSLGWGTGDPDRRRLTVDDDQHDPDNFKCADIAKADWIDHKTGKKGPREKMCATFGQDGSEDWSYGYEACPLSCGSCALAVEIPGGGLGCAWEDGNWHHGGRDDQGCAWVERATHSIEDRCAQKTGESLDQFGRKTKNEYAIWSCAKACGTCSAP